jgi:hypothetical protein
VDAGKAFFAPRKRKSNSKMSTTTTTTTTTMPETTDQDDTTPLALCQGVSKRVNDSEFAKKHKSKGAPLAMVAFAEVVLESIIRKGKTKCYFDGLTMLVPACHQDSNPHYHSIVGQKLLLVDWEKTHGLQVTCPNAACGVVLKDDRTNYSKNKTLFPIFGLDGAPSWCIVMSFVCPCCKRRFDANEGDVLINLPDYAADAYPVEPKFAFGNTNSHLARTATETFESIMLTYGNGELCSRLLYNAVNRNFVRRLKAYYSYAEQQKIPVADYIEKDGCYIKTFPPLGDTIRDMYDEASYSGSNHWRLSDFQRCTLEMQSVSTTGIITQDHTFQAAKNYQKRLGAKAAWDLATETGEIASCVLACYFNKNNRVCSCSSHNKY